ncbi:MAG: hypothetical protein KDD47_12080 [Acidobacteria bacterium]|nr:hypothetical protein [Acidobacteriota bacterium]
MSKKIALVLALALLAGLSGTFVAQATSQAATPVVECQAALPGTTLPTTGLFTTPLEEALQVTANGTFEDCLACYLDCENFSEPSRSRCLAWCYRTIPGCYL